MSDILCIYYSRTGNTKRMMEEISAALDAELVELKDKVERGGTRGYLRCGLDAMRKTTDPLELYETEKPLFAYRLVIVGTPVWAGRCSSVVRSFLRKQGGNLPDTAYVITRSGDSKFTEVYRQMDGYLHKPHLCDVSLRCNSVGCAFWQEEFIRTVKNHLAPE
ncbi:MAG: hypothetical protein RRY95_00395 [Oscillospiraceae bacterium]